MILFIQETRRLFMPFKIYGGGRGGGSSSCSGGMGERLRQETGASCADYVEESSHVYCLRCVFPGRAGRGG